MKFTVTQRFYDQTSFEGGQSYQLGSRTLERLIKNGQHKRLVDENGKNLASYTKEQLEALIKKVKIAEPEKTAAEVSFDRIDAEIEKLDNEKEKANKKIEELRGEMKAEGADKKKLAGEIESLKTAIKNYGLIQKTLSDSKKLMS